MAFLPSFSSVLSGHPPAHSCQTKPAGNAQNVGAGKGSTAGVVDDDTQYLLLINGGSTSPRDDDDNNNNIKWERFRHGNSMSPEMFDALQTSRSIWESPITSAVAASVALLGVPMIAYGSFVPANTLPNFIIAIWSAWDGLLSISSLIVLALTISGAFIYVELAKSVQPLSSPQRKSSAVQGDLDLVEACCSGSRSTKLDDDVVECITTKVVVKKVKKYVFSTRQRLFNSVAGVILLFVLILLGVVGPYTLVYPSWLWHPFLWGRYHVYDPKDVLSAASHVCQNDKGHDLCLNKREWEVLSSGAISPANRHDVFRVKAGQAYAKENSIVVSILARNIKEGIPALKANVESLVPLFKRVALVVFENDSTDGTREEFKAWSMETAGKNYVVDVMECEGVVDCKYDRDHRDSAGVIDYDYSPSIGDMHTYRNTAIQYIIHDSKYQDFSHVLVLDADLAVPFSPLGILHTLGSKPDHAVASTGRQPFPTAFGSFTTPYDLNAFREYNTPQTKGLEIWHERFCSIMPPGERWHSECDALAPTHLVAVIWNDRKRLDDDLYRVRSAFNGAVLYPTQLLRQTGALYDDGDASGIDRGQRCEHVGMNFKISQTKPMYVNRKWDIHLLPNSPGGPAGARAQKVTNRITSKPKLMLTVLISHILTVGLFVWATFTIGVYAVQPIVSALLKETKSSRKWKTVDPEVVAVVEVTGKISV